MSGTAAVRLVRWTRSGVRGIPLVCFPWAGAGASPYRNWPVWLPDDVEVWAARLPGRENRIRETPATDLDSLVSEFADAIEQELDRGPVLLGHCFGAWLAYELAFELRRRGYLLPRQLMVVAQSAPSLPLAKESLERFRALGYADEQVLHDPEMMDLLRPALEADIWLMSRFRHRPERRLDIPITVLIGRDDRFIDRTGLLAWERETAAEFDLIDIEGDHFFSGSSTPGLVRAVGGGILREGSDAVRGAAS